jgi:hypothetical protein
LLFVGCSTCERGCLRYGESVPSVVQTLKGRLLPPPRARRQRSTAQSNCWGSQAARCRAGTSTSPPSAQAGAAPTWARRLRTARPSRGRHPSCGHGSTGPPCQVGPTARSRATGGRCPGKGVQRHSARLPVPTTLSMLSDLKLRRFGPVVWGDVQPRCFAVHSRAQRASAIPSPISVLHMSPTLFY